MSFSSSLHAVLTQVRAETLLTLRRGESLLVTVIIPVAVLIFFASSPILPSVGRGIGFLLAGTLALAVISTGLVSLGIATAYERYYGVLKRLGVTPLPRSGLIAAKIISVLLLEVVQVVLLVGIAVLLYGWRPHGPAIGMIVVILLGTTTFAGLGLLMAGTLRAEATLAGANGLYLFFLLLGGLYLPLSDLPLPLRLLAQVLPAEPLASLLRTALNGRTLSISALVALLAWTVMAPVLAALTFRWE
jgi:ABC-2 type transport system permease protein